MTSCDPGCTWPQLGCWHRGLGSRGQLLHTEVHWGQGWGRLPQIPEALDCLGGLQWRPRSRCYWSPLDTDLRTLLTGWPQPGLCLTDGGARVGGGLSSCEESLENSLMGSKSASSGGFKLNHPIKLLIWGRHRAREIEWSGLLSPERQLSSLKPNWQTWCKVTYSSVWGRRGDGVDTDKPASSHAS